MYQCLPFFTNTGHFDRQGPPRFNFPLLKIQERGILKDEIGIFLKVLPCHVKVNEKVFERGAEGILAVVNALVHNIECFPHEETVFALNLFEPLQRFFGNDEVAGDDNRHRIEPDGMCHGSHSGPLTKRLRKLGVAEKSGAGIGAVGDVEKGLPYFQLEFCAHEKEVVPDYAFREVEKSFGGNPFCENAVYLTCGDLGQETGKTGIVVRGGGNFSVDAGEYPLWSGGHNKKGNPKACKGRKIILFSTF